MKDAMISALDPSSTVSASSFVQRLSLSRDAAALVAGGANVRRCVDEMLARGMQADALAVIARALPKRYVVAWACECFKGVLAAQPAADDVDRAGLALTQQWVSDPSEEHRRAAQEFADLGELRSPGAWLAASAGWTGGSLTPRGYDALPPPDHLPAEAAIAALRLVATQSADYAGAVSGFVTRALQIFGPPAHSAPKETHQ
jgi:hypothetical protein